MTKNHFLCATVCFIYLFICLFNSWSMAKFSVWVTAFRKRSHGGRLHWLYVWKLIGATPHTYMVIMEKYTLTVTHWHTPWHYYSSVLPTDRCIYVVGLEWHFSIWIYIFHLSYLDLRNVNWVSQIATIWLRMVVLCLFITLLCTNSCSLYTVCQRHYHCRHKSIK